MTIAPVQISVCSVLFDQMPPGMRETLYFKDDDSRLFLFAREIM